MFKNVKTQISAGLLQKYGQPHMPEQMLQEFNSNLLRLSCHRLFILNSQSFDGSSLIKRFGEYHALLLTIQSRQQ